MVPARVCLDHGQELAGRATGRVSSGETPSVISSLAMPRASRAEADPRFIPAAELRTLRESRGLTQKEAAALCGVDERSFQRWESGAVVKVRRALVEPLRKARSRSR